MNEPLFEEKTLYGKQTRGASVPVRRSERKVKPFPLGEVAVDGLLQGVAAGIVMLLVFLALGALEGYAPSRILSALGLTHDATQVQGALVHLAIGAIYGVLWSLLIALPVRLYFPEIETATWVAVGLGFGCLTWLVAEAALFAVTGLSMLPWYALLMAHLLYGGTLGLIQARHGTLRE